MDEILRMMPFRKCFFSKGCKQQAEFRVYSDPMLIPTPGSIAIAVASTNLCAFHTRQQLKYAHDENRSLNIDKLS